MAIQPRLYTVEEFETFTDLPENRNRLLELIHGEIAEKVPTEKHGMLAGNVYGPIWNWVQKTKLGRVVMEVRYHKAGDEHNARIPDVSYTSFATNQHQAVEKGSVPHLPDLAVEVKSPDDTMREMREKARYYLANGSKMVWLIIPTKRIIEVYAADFEDTLTTDDILDGRDVLPGFTLAVRDVFADPVDEQNEQDE